MSKTSLSPEDTATNMLVAIYHMEQLIEKGFIDGPLALTEDGKRRAKELIDAGYQVPPDELRKIVAYLKEYGLSQAYALKEIA